MVFKKIWKDIKGETDIDIVEKLKTVLTLFTDFKNSFQFVGEFIEFIKKQFDKFKEYMNKIDINIMKLIETSLSGISVIIFHLVNMFGEIITFLLKKLKIIQGLSYMMIFLSISYSLTIFQLLSFFLNVLISKKQSIIISAIVSLLFVLFVSLNTEKIMSKGVNIVKNIMEDIDIQKVIKKSINEMTEEIEKLF